MAHDEQKPVSTHGFMRVFLETDTADSAHKIGSILCEQLPASLHPEVTNVRKYWKIEEWFEVVIKFYNTTSIEETLAGVQALSTKWETRIYETEATALWSPEIGGNFAHPQVRWANVECFHQS
jgi:hypothetical protein